MSFLTHFMVDLVSRQESWMRVGHVQSGRVQWVAIPGPWLSGIHELPWMLAKRRHKQDETAIGQTPLTSSAGEVARLVSSWGWRMPSGEDPGKSFSLMSLASSS